MIYLHERKIKNLKLILGVSIVNGNFDQKIQKYFICYVTKMIVKITNVVKRIVIL